MKMVEIRENQAFCEATIQITDKNKFDGITHMYKHWFRSIKQTIAWALVEQTHNLNSSISGLYIYLTWAGTWKINVSTIIDNLLS